MLGRPPGSTSLTILTSVNPLPSVRLPSHPAKAGILLQWRQDLRGDWWALVEFTVVVPGYKGGIGHEQSWFPAREVEPIPGEDYRRVPRTRAAPEQP